MPDDDGRIKFLANLSTAIVNPIALIATVITLIVTSCNTNKQFELSNKQLELSSKQLEVSAQAFQGNLFYQALKRFQRGV